MLAVLAEGSAARATAATSLNAHSSRSHALLSVRLTDAGGQASVLHLVDLAGACFCGGGHYTLSLLCSGGSGVWSGWTCQRLCADSTW